MQNGHWADQTWQNVATASGTYSDGSIHHSYSGVETMPLLRSYKESFFLPLAVA